MAKFSWLKNPINEAISYLLLSIEASKKRNDQVGLANHYYNIGNCFFQNDNVPMAQQYISESLELAEKNQLKKTLKEVYRTLKDIAFAQKDYPKAIDYYDLFLEVSNQLFNEEKSNIIRAMEASKAFEKKEQQLELTNKNLEILKQKNKSNNLTILVLFFGIISIIAITWIILLKKNKKIEEHQKDLTRAQNKTTQLQDELKAKHKELTSYMYNFIQKNELIQEIKEIVDTLKDNAPTRQMYRIGKLSNKIKTAINIDEDWNAFRKHFENVYPQLINQLNQQYPDLTQNEFKLIALVRMNLSSKEISKVLGISPDSVKTARYRLRKKLQIDNSTNLFEFLINQPPTNT